MIPLFRYARISRITPASPIRFRKTVDQDVVVDPVEELLQVHVHHDPPARLHVRLRREHGVVRASARPEAVAVLAEGRIKNRLQHLQQRLLDQPIRHRRDAKLALASLRLRDRYPPHRHWAGTSPTTVVPGSRATPCADARPSGRCPDRPRRLRPCWPVPVSTPAAGSLLSAPPPAALALCSPDSCRGRAGFVAARATRGFTASYSRPPRSRGHLTHCLPHRHGVEHSFSFGPSPARRLCSLPADCRVGGGAQ